ncbi:MAG: peptidoglycan editing factor PgeF, partial [Bacteroidota bacterium]
MILEHYNNLPLYKFEHLNEEKNILHFITTRKREKPCLSFNLGYNSGDAHAIVFQNRNKLAEILQIDLTQLIFQKQVHGINIAEIYEPNKDLTEIAYTDGLITNRKKILLCVKAADCVPLIFYDDEKKVCAVAHAGWKGTFLRIAKKMIEKMKADFSCNPQNIKVGIGPSAGPDNYEVGLDIVTKFRESFTNSSLFIIQKNDKYFLNLWECNKMQLIESGLAEKNIEI